MMVYKRFIKKGVLLDGQKLSIELGTRENMKERRQIVPREKNFIRKQRFDNYKFDLI
jgi:hypothetical protein